MNIQTLILFKRLRLFIARKFFIKSPFFVRILVLLFVNRILHLPIKRFGSSMYPVDCHGKSLFCKNLFPSVNQEDFIFVSNYYKVNNFNDYWVKPTDLLNYTAEILPVRRIEPSVKSKLLIEQDSLLPVSIVNTKFHNIQDDQFEIRLSVNDQHYRLRNLAQNRFYYFPFRSQDVVKVECDFQHLVGKPMKLVSTETCKKRLVLTVFVDGLAAEIFEHQEFSSLMPCTARFFNRGLVTFNGHTNSDWTDPSVPTIATGLYAINHRVLNESSTEFGNGFRTIAELFQSSGYVTTQICGNYGKTPSSKFVLGYDRTIYRRSMGIHEVVSNFFDHIRAFANTNNFVWLSIMDLHHFLDIVPTVDVQSTLEIKNHDYKDVKTPSVVGAYNPIRTERFCRELNRIDFYLGQIFSHIEDSYCPSDVLVSLVSDHGQPYITQDKELFSRQRTRVPIMIYDGNLDDCHFGSRMDNVDIVPTLLHLAGIENTDFSNFDGIVPKCLGGTRDREVSLAESIFPGKPYVVVMVDDQHRFYFETHAVVDEFGFFALDELDANTAILHDARTGQDVTKDFPEKCNFFVKSIKNHVTSSRFCEGYRGFKDFR